jgi:hypothetical protein
MSKRKGRSPELFEEFVLQKQIEYPVVIEYSSGERYGDNNIEMFLQNGVSAFVSIKDNSCTFSKKKFIPKNSTTEEEAIIEYEMFIRTLMYIHKESDNEEFEKKWKEMDSINNKLDEISFSETFKQAKGMFYEQNLSGFLKKKKGDINNEESIVIKQENDTDHPF